MQVHAAAITGAELDGGQDHGGHLVEPTDALPAENHVSALHDERVSGLRHCLGARILVSDSPMDRLFFFHLVNFQYLFF